MQTVQMTLDERLVKKVDAHCRRVDTTRSAFTRQALSAELRRQGILEMEKKHRESYEQDPEGERELISDYQVWPDWTE